MKKLLCVFLFLCGCNIVPVHDLKEQDYAVKSITQLSDIDLNHLDSKTLIVFDVDGVLTLPNATTGMFTTYQKEYGDIIKDLQNTYPDYKNNYDLYCSIIFKGQEEMIIDPNLEKILNHLKKQGIKTIACSAWPSGPQGLIQSQAEHRYSVLKNLNIVFDWSFPDVIFKLKEEQGPRKKYQPVYYRGIICADGQDKGSSLLDFFQKIHFMPKKIIFIDDSLKKIDEVRQMCEKNNIHFVGYHYTRILPTNKRWKPDLVRFKLERLIREKKWFKNDEEALKAFKN